MKKYLFLPLIVFMLSSCSPKYYESMTVADFSEYVEDGFYIYPVGTEVKEKNYIPISSINLSFIIGRESDYSKNKLKEKDFVKDMNSFVIPNGEYITKRVVEEARKFNADAIINYEIISVGKNLVAKGVAVKIK